MAETAARPDYVTSFKKPASSSPTWKYEDMEINLEALSGVWKLYGKS